MRHKRWPLWSMTENMTLVMTVMLHDKCDDHGPGDPPIWPRSLELEQSCPPTMTTLQMVTITLLSSTHSQDQSSIMTRLDLTKFNFPISNIWIHNCWPICLHIYNHFRYWGSIYKIFSHDEGKRKCGGNEVISLMTSYCYCYEANSYFLQHLLFCHHRTFIIGSELQIWDFKIFIAMKVKVYCSAQQPFNLPASWSSNWRWLLPPHRIIGGNLTEPSAPSLAGWL